MREAAKLILVNGLVLFALLGTMELVAQMVALVRPSFEVIFLAPDRNLGWKQPPNHRFTWTDHHWYAADFSVPVASNSLGFRDVEHSLIKPPGVRRVAIIGDSFIEAIQVPFEATAAHLVERSLNGVSTRGVPDKPSWEVLNFGVSNYGVGQYLLVWEEYARRFNPDYVVIFVARLHFERTLSKYEGGAFKESRRDSLWIRPTFRLDGDTLIREPATDYEAFRAAQQKLIVTAFDGERSRVRRQLVVPRLAIDGFRGIRGWLNGRDRNVNASDDSGVLGGVGADYVLDPINRRLLSELNGSVKAAGGRLVLLDASQFFGDDLAVSREIEAICRQTGVGYVPVYKDFQSAEAAGALLRWSHDNHLNLRGNDILANSLVAWIRLDAAAKADGSRSLGGRREDADYDRGMR